MNLLQQNLSSISECFIGPHGCIITILPSKMGFSLSPAAPVAVEQYSPDSLTGKNNNFVRQERKADICVNAQHFLSVGSMQPSKYEEF